MKDGYYYTQKEKEIEDTVDDTTEDDSYNNTHSDNVSGCTQFWNDVVDHCDKAQQQQV